MPVGRPSKVQRFIEVAETVLYEDDIMLLTDEELVFLINKELIGNEKITDRTFQNWKSGEIKDEYSKEFFRLIKDALIMQKKSLFVKFGTDSKAWTRWAWIIERKFSEWNLKHISENKNDNKNDNTTRIINLGSGSDPDEATT